MICPNCGRSYPGAIHDRMNITCPCGYKYYGANNIVKSETMTELRDAFMSQLLCADKDERKAELMSWHKDAATLTARVDKLELTLDQYRLLFDYMASIIGAAGKVEL